MSTVTHSGDVAPDEDAAEDAIPLPAPPDDEDYPDDAPPDNVRPLPKRPRVPGIVLSDTDPALLYAHGDDPERGAEPGTRELLAEPLRMREATPEATHRQVGGAVAAALDGRLRRDKNGDWWLWNRKWLKVDAATVDSIIKDLIGRADAESRAVRSIIPHKSYKLTRELIAQLDAAGAGRFDPATQQFRRADGEVVTTWPFAADEWAESTEQAARIRGDVAGRESVDFDDLFDMDEEVVHAHGTVIDISRESLLGDAVRTCPLNRRVLISRSLGPAYDPEALCPHWRRFVDEVTSYRDLRTGEIVYQPELALFLQVLAGLTLLGRLQEQLIVVLQGDTGSNGKSVFGHVLMKVMDEYGAYVPKAILAPTRADTHTTDWTTLRGARMGYTKEPVNGPWDSSSTKDLASNEELTGRGMRENNSSWKPTHMMWVTVNPTPVPAQPDLAFYRRIVMVPFKQRWFSENDTDAMKAASIGEINPNLTAELAKELPGILNWMIDGLRRYYQDGKLVVPQVVKAANQDAEIDGSLWNEFCVTALTPVHTEVDAASKRSLFDAWTAYCHRNGTPVKAADPSDAEGVETRLKQNFPGARKIGGHTSGRNSTVRILGVGLSPLGAELVSERAAEKQAAKDRATGGAR